MKKSFLVVCLLMVVLGVSLVAAAWPFTGKVVDGTEIDDAEFNNCADSDGGVYSEIAGIVTYRGWIGGDKTKEDVCRGSSRVREYYCHETNGRVKSKIVRCASGVCEDGACVSVEPFCNDTDEGVVTNEGVFKNKCQGKKAITYSCDGTEKVETEENCSNRCSQGACAGICVEETDTEDDKDVSGKGTLDGEPFKDECVGTSRVRQYFCSSNGRKLSSVVSCGRNRECVESDEGDYCHDMYASSDISAGLIRQDVLDILNGCQVVEGATVPNGGVANCNAVCNSLGDTCIFAEEVTFDQSTGLDVSNKMSVCGAYYGADGSHGSEDKKLRCLCC